MDSGEQFALLDLDRKKQVCKSSKLSVSGLCLGCQRVTSVIITTSKYSERQASFWLQKLEEFDNPSRPVHIPLLDNENFFFNGN